MASHGENRMNGNGIPRPLTDAPSRIGGGVSRAGTDAWHSRLTGRQSHEPVSGKLRLTYGHIRAEDLSHTILTPLCRLDQKSSVLPTPPITNLHRHKKNTPP